MELAVRLDALEREVRRLRVGCGAMALVFAGALLLGATPSKELEVTKLTVVDAEGTKRFELATTPEGMAHFVARDPGGNDRLAMVTGNEGQAVLVAMDVMGKHRVALGTVGVGLGFLESRDAAGAIRFRTATVPNREAGWVAYDTAAKIRFGVWTRANGAATFEAMGPEQKPRLILGTTAADETEIRIQDLDGKVTWSTKNETD